MSRPSFGELGGYDPYEILELESGASDAEVRSARKRLLRLYHPDLPTGDIEVIACLCQTVATRCRTVNDGVKQATFSVGRHGRHCARPAPLRG